MALAGIPISENECIGDSLQTINNAFSNLDTRLDSVSSQAGVTRIIPGAGIIVSPANGKGDVTVSYNDIGTLQTPTVISGTTATYTITDADFQKMIIVTSTVDVTITLPWNVSTGLDISIIRATANNVTLAGAAGITVESTPDDTFRKLAFNGSVAGAYYRGSSIWYVFGDLLPV